jgi:hypothetical protein
VAWLDVYLVDPKNNSLIFPNSFFSMNVAKIVAEDNDTFTSCPEGLRRLQETQRYRVDVHLIGKMTNLPPKSLK